MIFSFVGVFLLFVVNASTSIASNESCDVAGSVDRLLLHDFLL